MSVNKDKWDQTRKYLSLPFQPYHDNEIPNNILIKYAKNYRKSLSKKLIESCFLSDNILNNGNNRYTNIDLKLFFSTYDDIKEPIKLDSLFIEELYMKLHQYESNEDCVNFIHFLVKEDIFDGWNKYDQNNRRLYKSPLDTRTFKIYKVLENE